MAQKPPQSYTELYFEIIQEIGRADIGRHIFRWIKIFIALGWVLIGIAIILNPEQRLLLMIVGVIITLFFVGVGMIIGLIYVAWAGSQDPLERVPGLTTQLLVAVLRPHSQSRGLRYKELQHLQQVATIEQNAADWRGNFVSLVIVGLFLGTISFLLQPPEFIGRWQETASSAAQIPVTINIPWANWTLTSALTTSSNVFSFSISTLLLLLVVIQLARYWAKFFLSESPNRIVLFACTEALALLEANGLETRPAFTMPEKRFLARQLGFDFHSRTGIALPLYIDDNGRGWYLESLIPSPSRKWANSLIQWIWQRLNIRQVVSEEEE